MCGARRRGFFQRQQALPEGVPGGLGAVSNADLLVDVGYVPPGGAIGDHQFLGDLAVAFAMGQEAQDLDLPFCEAVWVSGYGNRNRLNLSQPVTENCICPITPW